MNLPNNIIKSSSVVNRLDINQPDDYAGDVILGNET